MKVTLTKPIVWADETISELDIQEPLAEHIWDADWTPNENGSTTFTPGQMLGMAGLTAGYPPSAMRKLTLGDALKVMEAVSVFFPQPESEDPEKPST